MQGFMAMIGALLAAAAAGDAKLPPDLFSARRHSQYGGGGAGGRMKRHPLRDIRLWEGRYMTRATFAKVNPGHYGGRA